jgi:cytidine deaminase
MNNLFPFEVDMNFNDPQSQAWNALVEVAWQGWSQAHAPYSGFHVGAALLRASGEIVVGCNVENAAYPSSLCAERTAICAAVAQGMKPGELKALVVVTEAPTLTPPCGACRQVIAEFADDLPILLVNREQRALHGLADLLPHAFTSRNLNA